MPLSRNRYQTIDEVILRMDELIEASIREKSKAGYFAVLYRNVTARVKEGIMSGRFEDGERMERLDVIFATRYIDAYDQYHRGEPLSRCWKSAFEALEESSPVILQHLLLGMNAHINLDLGIAAAQTASGDEFAQLRNDFDEITHLLGEMLDEVQERINNVSPWLGIIDIVGGRTDEDMFSFAIGEARKLAWKSAEKLAHAPSEEIFGLEVDLFDRIVAELAKGIQNPGVLVKLALFFIRMRESNDVVKVIEAMRE